MTLETFWKSIPLDTPYSLSFLNCLSQNKTKTLYTHTHKIQGPVLLTRFIVLTGSFLSYIFERSFTPNKDNVPTFEN